MITIIIQNGIPFIWNASDWLKIREDYRIIGNLTGCLVGLPRQETLQGLPLALLPEEVTLLLEKNLVSVVSDTALSKAHDQKSKEAFLLYKEKNKEEQMTCYEEQRTKQISSMIDRIIEGKRRKLLGTSKQKKIGSHDQDGSKDEVQSLDVELDREEILKNEINKSAASFSPPLLVQTFTSDQCIEESEQQKVNWSFPETAQEKLRYLTYKNLWEKGFYITEGHKFGVDFLVYPGDPIKFHAQFLVGCMKYDEDLPTVDIISYARLGSISRKTFVIATQLPNTEDIHYQSVQWTEGT